MRWPFYLTVNLVLAGFVSVTFGSVLLVNGASEARQLDEAGAILEQFLAAGEGGAPRLLVFVMTGDETRRDLLEVEGKRGFFAAAADWAARRGRAAPVPDEAALEGLPAVRFSAQRWVLPQQRRLRNERLAQLLSRAASTGTRLQVLALGALGSEAALDALDGAPSAPLERFLALGARPEGQERHLGARRNIKETAAIWRDGGRTAVAQLGPGGWSRLELGLGSADGAAVLRALRALMERNETLGVAALKARPSRLVLAGKWTGRFSFGGVEFPFELELKQTGVYLEGRILEASAPSGPLELPGEITGAIDSPQLGLDALGLFLTRRWPPGGPPPRIAEALSKDPGACQALWDKARAEHDRTMGQEKVWVETTDPESLRCERLARLKEDYALQLNVNPVRDARAVEGYWNSYTTYSDGLFRMSR